MALPMALNHDDPVETGDARITERHLVSGALQCTLGKVIDLSALGALVVTRSAPPQGVIPFEVADAHGSLRCAATIVWSRRCGLFRHEAGVMFPALNAEQLATVRRLVEMHGLANEYRQRRDAA